MMRRGARFWGWSSRSGVLAGYQMIDVKVQIVDGTFHEVDSNELAFKMAGIFAFKDAAKKAHMVLLEPIMKVEVTTPDEYQGDLLGDISRRRGHIVNIEAKLGQTILNARVPLAEMFGYATAIRSLSKGRASYSMEPLTFEQVPSGILNTILDQAAKKRRRAAKKEAALRVERCRCGELSMCSFSLLGMLGG